MSALGETLSALTRALSHVGARWYLFGAQAVAVHGVPRATQDVDVTVDLGRASAGQLVAALSTEGFRHRFPELADELARTGAVLPFVHTPTGMDLDLVLAGSGLEALVLGRCTVEPVDGVPVPVASPTDLVVLKVLAGRGRDLDDVRGLLARGGVDVAEARDLLGQLEEALGQSDLVPALERAVREVR